MTMYTRLRTALTLLLVLILGIGALQAQTVLSNTTLSVAITGFPDAAGNTVRVASATGITANTTGLFVVTTGEYMPVTAVSGTTLTVVRGGDGTRAWPAATSAVVLVVPAAATVQFNPVGPCTRGSGLARYQPVINTRTGDVSICRLAGTWATTNATVFTPNSTQLTP